MMDPALTMRIECDKQKTISETERKQILRSSPLVGKLTASFVHKPSYAVWRIIALAEIPYAKELEYTHQVIEYINDNLATPSGFSLSGKENDLLPCYNAMLLEALTKLGYEDSDQVRNAVAWIKKYQPFARDIPNTWEGKGARKYGGCLKSTPCYIGIAKTVKALICYSNAINHSDGKVVSLAEQGTEYLLRHELYKRLSTGEPINRHIMDIAFPASYMLNMVDLLEIMHLTGNISHPQCRSALEYLKNKKCADGSWQIDYCYSGDGYISFDRKGKPGEWVTYLLGRYLML